MSRVIHFEIHCSDLDRAQRFFEDVFGWTIDRWEGSPVDYRLVTTGPDDEMGINGALVERRGEIDGQAVMGYVNTVQVADLADTQRRIADGGGEQVLDPVTIPEVGTVAYFKDTEGNVFGALQPAR
ncbi:MAG TPA: VOC family protein [Solirubrobacteraceae bacterium]|nr:VOC family protein [Solirubrobacteraceae bacterium]